MNADRKSSLFQSALICVHPRFISLLDLIQIALAAILLRLAVIAISLHIGHISLAACANKGDGESYLRYARWINGDGSAMTDYDRRVFPGYPAMIALLGRCGVALPLAAVGIDAVAAAAVAMLAALAFEDRRIGWAMVALLPHWVINSSLAMSEAPMLALSVAGIFCTTRNRPIAAGILFGCAGLVRPMACFAALAGAIGLFQRRRRADAILALAVAVAVVLIGVAALQCFTGAALHGMHVYANSPRAYGGEMLAWPGKSLIFAPARLHASIGKIIYIYAHVLIALIGIAMLARAAKSDWRSAMCFVWLAGNTALLLCIGSTWGFAHFPRFTIPAQPALAWAWRKYLPAARWPWIVLAIAMLGMGVAGVLSTP